MAADIPGLLQAGRDVGAQTIDFTLGPDDSGVPPPTYVEMADAIATVDILAIDLDTKLGSLGVTDSGDLRLMKCEPSISLPIMNGLVLQHGDIPCLNTTGSIC